MEIHYPGGKGGEGVYQKYINLMPPHEVYIETHLGGGALMRKKRPAKQNIGIDIDPKIKEMWLKIKEPSIKFYQTDAVEFLKNYNWTGKEFVYCDPPYLRESRKKECKLYKYEYTRQQHIELLETIKKIPAMVMISGYETELYKEYLHDWHVYSFQAKTRSSTAIEWIWMNYPHPTALHDYRYLGNNFRERERFKKIFKTWERRIQQMSVLERRILSNILCSFLEEK